MKIIIAGAGRIGSSVAETLCTEGHDITIIEKDQETAGAVSNNVDAICITGNAANPNVLRDAGAETADLILAITESDETNMLCGITAEKLGTARSVVRVRSPEYIGETALLRDMFGFPFIINPEYECAKEIARIIRFPGASRVAPFSGGSLEIAEHRICGDSILCGKKLKELPSFINAKVLVSLAEREHSAVIPNGDFTIQENDILSLAGPDKELRKFFLSVNAYKTKIRNTMIVGGGTTSVYLARLLEKSGISVTVIERDRSRCDKLCDLIPDCRIICGDATRSEVLIEEGVRSADSFVALTGDDGENIITSIYAHHCGAGRIITQVAHEHFTEAAESSDLACVVTPKAIVVDQITGLVRGMNNSEGCSPELVYTLADGHAEAIELKAEENKKITGIPLKDLCLKPGILIAAIIRSGKSIIPGGTDEILPGDRIVIVAKSETVREPEDILV